MKIFDKFRKRQIKNEVTITPEQEEIMWSNTENSSMLLSSAYYSCMQIRCNALAKMPIKILKKDKDGTHIQTDTSLYTLLKLRPNKFTNAHDFLWATEYFRLEYGNAYWYPKIINGEVKAIYLLDSRNVQIVYDNIGLLDDNKKVYYFYSDPHYGQFVYTEDEIVHFKNYSLDGIAGRGIKKYLADTINTEKSGQSVLKERYDKGLQDPIIVTYTGDLNDSNKGRIQRKFESIGGTQSAGKVIPIPSDFSVSQLETKLVNNQFFELQELTTRRIANAFGVKSFQLNDMNKSTYTNITEQNKAFYVDTMQNVVTTYEQEMTYKLLSQGQMKNGIYIHFNVDVLLRSDLQTRYNAYAQGISAGFLTIAEARDKEELPFMSDTDKLIIGNGASIPLSDLGSQYLKNTPENGQ